MKASNLPTVVKFENAKNQIFVFSLQEIMGGYETGRGHGAKPGGLCQGLKPPLVLGIMAFWPNSILGIIQVVSLSRLALWLFYSVTFFVMNHLLTRILVLIV